jgi:hypothetical protein
VTVGINPEIKQLWHLEVAKDFVSRKTEFQIVQARKNSFHSDCEGVVKQ